METSPRPDQGGVGLEASGDRAGRAAEKHGQGPPSEGEDGSAVEGVLEDVVDHRLEHGPRPVAQQDFQDGEVDTRKAGRAPETPEAPRGPVASRPPVRALLAQGVADVAELPGGQLLVAFDLPAAPAGAPAPASTRNGVFPVGHPHGERRRLRVPVGEARCGVRQVKREQAMFMGGQHGIPSGPSSRRNTSLPLRHIRS